MLVASAGPLTKATIKGPPVPCITVPPSFPASNSRSSSYLLTTYLVDVPPNLVAPLLAFNFAVWRYREPAHAAKDAQSPQWVAQRIFELASTLLRRIKAPTRKRKNNFDNNAIADDHSASLVEAGPAAVICYTDGSASPNPGPSGAGASLFLPSPGAIHDLGASLGHGTNNGAELYALGMLLTHLRTLSARSPRINNAIVFSDSRYALNAATAKKPPLTNIPICLALRKAYTATCALINVQLRWVRGHAAIGGNERVDRISKRFAEASANGAAFPFDPSFPSSFSSLMCPLPFPISSLLSFFFLTRLPSPPLHVTPVVPSSAPTVAHPISRARKLSATCGGTRKSSRIASMNNHFVPVAAASSEELDFKHCD